MKISFMTFACPQWEYPAVLDAAIRLRYDGVEFRIDAGHAHGVEVATTAEQRRAIRWTLSDSGIEPCCLATSLYFSRDSALTDAPARIDLAAELGCPGLRVFCGKPLETTPMPELIQRVAERLRKVADQAHQAGVQLWMETHDEFSLAANAAAAVRLANHPAVGLNYDNMHPYRNGESLAETRDHISGLVRHCHFHDAVNQTGAAVITPVGEGGMPCNEMFAMLVDQNYTGYLSGEWFDQQYGPDTETSLKRFHADMTALAERYAVRIGATSEE